jgi:hypothetical protein
VDIQILLALAIPVRRSVSSGEFGWKGRKRFFLEKEAKTF